MIGRLLSGRYRIEEQVGTGGMAVVYRAHDTQTDEDVALKLLRPEYETDEEFVARFNGEAQAAAKVSHENIVNMLDVGMDGDARYIVMEYIDGVTLKQMIRASGTIPADEALPMAIRILAAVDHAHRNGIVHRDIKPQNILVDAQGVVKVADFGIARMKTSREDEAAAIGSVHYISPEQARGEQADEQSDLYSVGVVLYEMLTGQVPFDGETTLDVVLKHVSENPRSMRAINPKISRALDEVIMRALCKDKRLRYQTASEMAADLRQAIERPKGGFVRYPKITEIPAEGEGEEDADEAERAAQKARRRKKRRKLMLNISCVVALVALVGALLMLIQYMLDSIVLTDVTGRSAEEAVEAVEALGLRAELNYAYSEEVPEGRIVSQSPKAGERVRLDAAVNLTSSLGTQWYCLDDMTGWSLEEALTALDTAGVAGIRREYVQSDAPKGTIVSQDVESGWVSRDTPVTLYISGQSVVVPKLTGLTPESAKAVIEAEGLKLGLMTEGSASDARSGTVIEQSVEAGQSVLMGTSLDLTICAQQDVRYVPLAPLTVVVPLDDLRVEIELVAPSGEKSSGYAAILDEGMHSIFLSSTEPGKHTVNIYEDDVLFETLELTFE